MKKDREKVNSKKGLGSKGIPEKEVEQTEQASECSADSDCGKGQVCIRGRCVDGLEANES